MFPLFELESSYQDFMSGDLEPECIHDMGILCQQWLREFADDDQPERLAVQQLNNGKANTDDVTHRLVFAIAASLCVSGAEAGQVIQAYEEFINKNSWLLSGWVTRLTESIHPHHPVDVLATFDALPNPDMYESARNAYGISMTDVRWDACSWDYLKVFEGTLPRTGYEQALFRSLAFFPVDTASAIHQKFVQTQDDEKNLFHYRLQRIRTQLGTGYNNGYESTRQYGEKRATLSSEMLTSKERPSMADTIPMHKEPGFAQSLHNDLERNIEHFFENLGEKLYIAPGNWQYVDEITQAFLDAGVSAQMILCHGPWKTEDGAHYHPLDSALTHFSKLSQNNQRFYACLYKAYVAKFEPREIIQNCTSPEALAAVYRLTGDKVFLQAGNSQVRDIAMGVDLGL